MTDSLILASASPRRAQLLRQLEVDFEVVPADINEVHYEHLTAGELCQMNAYYKCRHVSKKFPDAVVLGVDTLVTLNGKVYGKPKNLREAQTMLRELSGKTHEVMSGVCLIHLRTHQQKILVEKTSVKFHKLDATEIRDYLSRINPLDKAGGYAIQEHGDSIVEKIEGSYSNVVGMPMERLQKELAEFGVNYAMA
ncbi:MAG: septum formation inhibitor Maf [Verrucomicrobiales bacterium]|nr:septum formation inhibitor Maf [Verrucomicrobiales bacterium]